MADEITAAIEASISGLEGADGTDTTGDAGSSDTDTPVVSGTENAGTAGSDGGSGAVADATAAAAGTTDDIDKILEEAGFKPTPAGQRENRIPYGRTKKIIGNALKKAQDTHTAALAERDTKLTAAQKRNQEADNWDRMVANEPDRLMGMLSTLHPALYSKFLTGKVTAAEVKEKVTGQVATTRPEPDAKFEDGSVGYSAEGLQKLLDWNAQQAEERAFTRASAEATKRFGPLEERYKAQQAYDAQVPKVRAQVANAEKEWGQPFKDDYAKDKDSEILAVMRANDGVDGRPFISFETAVARVLIPKLRADRDTMRADLIKEQNTASARASAAAQKTVPSATKTAVVADEDQSIEDVIAASIAHLR